MKQFHTAVIERKKSFAGIFAVQPYEAPWADEAIYFIRVESLEGDAPRLNARVQISADGVRWVEEGSAFPEISSAGDFFLRIRHFGGWLRLSGEASGLFVLTVQLVLKG